MSTPSLAFVNGANGHLGNNLVRYLLKQGVPVRASVRNLKAQTPLSDLACEVVPSDITDKASLIKALQGVEVCYAVGAVFKLWAKNPEAEIYQPNLQGTRNLIEAAAESGVKRIIYVSSIAALNAQLSPISERNGYNPDRRNAYFNSKNDGEKLAFQLAKQLGIELVAVLPSAMIGSEALGAMSYSYNIIDLILKGQVPIETGIALNWIDVKDVAKACLLAAQKGKNGERYIIANEKGMSIRETVKIARELYPERNLKLPMRVPRWLLLGLAHFMERSARWAGNAPKITVNDIRMFSGLKQDFDISKARRELGFAPKDPALAVREAMEYLLMRSR